MKTLFNLATNDNRKWDQSNSDYRTQKHLGDKWSLIPCYYLSSMNIPN